ncbi:MAG: hypothetical protein IJL72_04835, partial [Lachnospiraceae bacterium]|nr:hypothetical protein [Lachnospiraceae bacterium]
ITYRADCRNAEFGICRKEHRALFTGIRLLYNEKQIGRHRHTGDTEENIQKEGWKERGRIPAKEEV